VVSHAPVVAERLIRYSECNHELGSQLVGQSSPTTQGLGHGPIIFYRTGSPVQNASRVYSTS
jgi:hypothetical protein